ncbi:hypothetical protein O7634_28920 [Micromonospora sp. WMMD1120]|uniref:hypothetical protein n=1 Tax=Micromonospora sp. WMMD1120 TaxID=3016106 RepID=UPI00241735CE|nr:hypothetical protein [Micromonospora sp. WMMD1120]MDG4810798.1 hypothetical protein [Micromonospora sp. WMMD1120]
MVEDVLPRSDATPLSPRQQWPRWAPFAATAVSGTLAGAVAIGALAGQHALAGLPGVAIPGAVVLLVGAVFAVATVRPWGLRLPHRLVSVVVWTVAGLCLAGSCWLLLDLSQLVVEGTITDRDGNSGWLQFGERLALTAVGALFVATALAWRRTTLCARCGHVHAVVTVATEPPDPRPASRRVQLIAYLGCLAWLPYGGLHTLGALGVQGIEPGGYEPQLIAAVAFWAAIGLAIFLLLGLVSPWGQVFPWWAPPLAGRRVPRFLPIVPVWLIAPTFVLYGLGSAVFVLLLASGLVSWGDGDGDLGLVGFAQPISFAGYGVALVIAAISYQLRTRPVPAVFAPCPVAPKERV